MGRRDGSRGAWVLRLLLVVSLAAAVAFTGQSQAGAEDDGDGSSIELDTEWGDRGIVKGPTPDDQFRYPEGVAVEPDGSVYVADTINHRIVKLDGDTGKLDAEWGNKGIVTGPGLDDQFNRPHGVAVDPDGNVYVIDSNKKRIVKLNPYGKLDAEWGNKGIVTGPGLGDQFNRPYGVAVNPDGNVYVTDRDYAAEWGGNDKNRIVKLDPYGKLDAEWGNEGIVTGPTPDDKFSSPQGVAVGLDGFVYVSDSYNNRIVKLDGDDGGLVTEWGNEGIVGDGSSDDLFRYPNGVAVGPNGSVYVTNSGKNLIVQLDGDDGEIVTVWGTGGVVMADGKREPFSFPRGVIVKRAAPDVQFNSPRDVAVDLNGNVYVADMQNHRIVKLIDTSAPVSDVGNGSGGDCSDQSAFMAMIEDEGVGVDFGKVIDCAVLNQESLVKAGQLEEVRIEPQGRAGLSDNVKISFRTNNPVPEGGKVVVTFPENFEVGSDTSVVVNDVGDAANVESKDIPARSVTVVFNDQIEPGADVVLMLSDIKHPPVSGPPTEGGSVETQNSTGAPIDSCLHGNDGCTIGYTEVKPGFVTGLVFDLENEELDRADDDLLHTAAGSTGEIFVRFRTTNLVEMGDKVVVTFPEGFVVGSETEVTVNFEVGPDATVSDGIVTSSEGRTVDIYLWGEIQPGELVTLKLPDITNPPFTGQPQGGSIVTWDMDSWPGVEIDQSIDGAFDNEDDYHEACEAQVIASCEGAYVTVDRITPGKLTDNEVRLDNKKAGGTGPVTVTFRLDNPLPANGAIAVTFPKGFELDWDGQSTQARFIDPDEGTVEVAVYPDAEKTTAVFFRDGTGDELKPEEGEPVVVELTNIRNPQVSGQTHNFEIRTSVGN